MSLSKKVAWVLTGDGINCERETAEALKQCGFETHIRHLNDVIAEGVSTGELTDRVSLLALPGGFSFGDDLGSGKVLALKMAHGLRWDLPAYARAGGLVIGICNGFQALIKLGAFGRDLTITHNIGGRFIDRWEGLRVQGTRSVFLRGLESLELPIRHGEGRVIFSQPSGLEDRLDDGRACLVFEGDPNGSAGRIAGLCDQTGRILGLMPHPEAAVRWTALPDWTALPPLEGEPPAFSLFKNAAAAAQAVPQKSTPPNKEGDPKHVS